MNRPDLLIRVLIILLFAVLIVFVIEIAIDGFSDVNALELPDQYF
jgi:hypothetical protein